MIARRFTRRDCFARAFGNFLTLVIKCCCVQRFSDLFHSVAMILFVFTSASSIRACAAGIDEAEFCPVINKPSVTTKDGQSSALA